MVNLLSIVRHGAFELWKYETFYSFLFLKNAHNKTFTYFRRKIFYIKVTIKLYK